MKEIININDKFIGDIRNIIEKEIIEESNKEWYELFKLYRNKQSHFRHFSGFLFHDKEDNFYHFLPRQWPYYFQQDISYAKGAGTNNNFQKDFFFELLMEQDIFEYCDGLYKKVFIITNHIFKILLDAFKIKKDSGCDIDIKIQQKAVLLIHKYKFKQFR